MKVVSVLFLVGICMYSVLRAGSDEDDRMGW